MSAKDRANDPKRVYANPISHVNVLPNESNNDLADGPHGSSLTFKKNWKNKSFSDATGTSNVSRDNQYQTAEVSTRGAFGVSKNDHETANAARQDAYNDASSDAVNKRKEITKKGAEDVERGNKGRGKAKVIKVRS
jgi:hypothetical protein